jgi:dTMP kinase
MKFIVFEGLDGSGKSSLIASLETILTNYQIDYVRTREPGGTPLGEEIRQLILRTDGDAPTPRTELLLYEASRAQHVDRMIRPNLEAGRWVLCDRFSASSIAFQAGGRQISQYWVELLNQFATADLVPDLTVLLDLSVLEARRRREKRNIEIGESNDRIESEADQFHERVRQSFLAQANAFPDKWLVLDAGKSSNELVQILYEELKDRGWLGL